MRGHYNTIVNIFNSLAAGIADAIPPASELKILNEELFKSSQMYLLHKLYNVLANLIYAAAMDIAITGAIPMNYKYYEKKENI